MKKIVELAVAYCKNEPFHAAIVVGLAAFILLVFVVIIATAIRRASAKKKAETDALKAKTAALEEKYAALKEQHSALTSQKNTLEETASALAEKNTALSNQNAALTSQNAALEETASALAEKNTALSNQNAALEETASALAEENAALGEQNTKLGEQNAQLGEQNVKLGEQNVKLGEQNAKLGEQNAQLGEQNAQLGEQNAFLKETNEALQAKAAPAPQPTPEEKEAETTSEIPTEQAPLDALPKEEETEPRMLLDELMDADDSIDFYEEDETDQMARYKGKWVIFRLLTNDGGEEMFFFELHASNGEKLLSSEEYPTYNGALRGIETHKANILNNNFRITLSKKGDYMFKLLSGKNMLLCMGEHYATRARCESAIESAKRFAATAFIDENIEDQVVKVPIEDDSSPIEPPKDGYNGKWVIERKTSTDGDEVYYFELFTGNGERLLSSEEYTTYIGAVNGIHTHKNNIEKGNFRIVLTKHGDYIYKLLNRNGQLLCLGEHYKTKRLCQNAVESVKRFAKNASLLTSPEVKN